MPDSAALFTGDLHVFFQDAFDEAVAARPSAPSAHVQSYLLGVLTSAAQPEPLVVTDSLTLRYEAALRAAPARRFEDLRVLGDQILFTSGFFPEHLHKRGVDARYVTELGARAYRAASRLIVTTRESAIPDILDELAAGFRDFTALLHDVALTVLASARGTADLVRLCEDWIRDRSEHTARLLRSRGVTLPSGLLSS